MPPLLNEGNEPIHVHGQRWRYCHWWAFILENLEERSPKNLSPNMFTPRPPRFMPIFPTSTNDEQLTSYSFFPWHPFSPHYIPTIILILFFTIFPIYKFARHRNEYSLIMAEKDRCFRYNMSRRLLYGGENKSNRNSLLNFIQEHLIRWIYSFKRKPSRIFHWGDWAIGHQKVRQ